MKNKTKLCTKLLASLTHAFAIPHSKVVFTIKRGDFISNFNIAYDFEADTVGTIWNELFFGVVDVY